MSEDDGLTCWRELIFNAMDCSGDRWSDVVRCTLDDAGLDKRFDNGFGCAEGEPFTLWTTKRVYFPVEYDGAESVASAPRDPCDEIMSHVG
jgi:hypothetical protein